MALCGDHIASQSSPYMVGTRTMSGWRRWTVTKFEVTAEVVAKSAH